MLRTVCQAAIPPVGPVPAPPLRQRAVIVEDDPESARRLQQLIAVHCPELELVGMANDFDSASALLRRSDFDVAFLDVELGSSGTCFQLLQEIGRPAFRLVIVSAFERYALPAIKFSAVDYLLKPVDPTELRCCSGKLNGVAPPAPGAAPAAPASKVILRQGDQVYIKEIAELLFLKARGFYTQVHFFHQGGLRSVTVSKPLNELEAEWQSPALLRVHKSFMVNMSFVQQVRKSGDGLLLYMQSGVEVPVARRRTASFMSQYSA